MDILDLQRKKKELKKSAPERMGKYKVDYVKKPDMFGTKVEKEKVKKPEDKKLKEAKRKIRKKKQQKYEKRIKSKAFGKPKAKLGVKASPEKAVSEGEYSFFNSSQKSSENGNNKGKSIFFKRSYDTEKEAGKKWLMG